MARETIFQHWILKDYILPFLLVFVIVFGILEKTKLLGDGKKQLNAIVAFVIGLIFAIALSPKEIVGNMILFLTVALVIMFVFLLLYGFVSGNKDGFDLNPKFKIVLGVIIGIAVVIATLWATGVNTNIFDFLFKQSWSEMFWTNFFFVVMIVIALSLVLRGKS